MVSLLVLLAGDGLGDFLDGDGDTVDGLDALRPPGLRRGDVPYVSVWFESVWEGGE